MAFSTLLFAMAFALPPPLCYPPIPKLRSLHFPSTTTPRPTRLSLSCFPARKYSGVRGHHSASTNALHRVCDRDRTVNPITGKNRYGHVIPEKDRLYRCPHCDNLYRKLMFPSVVDFNDFLDMEGTKNHVSEFHPEFDCCCKKCNTCFETLEELKQHGKEFCPVIVMTR